MFSMSIEASIDVSLTRFCTIVRLIRSGYILKNVKFGNAEPNDRETEIIAIHFE